MLGIISENKSTPGHIIVNFQNSGKKIKISLKTIKHKGSEIIMALDYSNIDRRQ